MPSRQVKVSVAPRREPPGLELEESFSFGSFDEDDKDNALTKNKQNSFRLNIRKVIKNAESVGKSVGFDRIRSLPMTKKEKLRNTTKLDMNSQVTKVITTNNDGKLDRRAVLKEGDALYSNSWRAKNNSVFSIQSSPEVVEGGATNASDLHSKSSRDDENESGPGYINSFVTALGFGSSKESSRENNNRSFPSLELKTSIVSAQTQSVEVRLSEKEVKKLYETSVKAAKDGEWIVVVNNIMYSRNIVGIQPLDYDKKNLFHIVASQKSVPEGVFDLMMEADPQAHRKVDEHGCVPLHYAASVGRNGEMVKYLLKKWPFGASARNVDGDLPLHVAVWCGAGNDYIAREILRAYPAALIAGNEIGGTPLHLASCGETASPRIVQMLLEKHEEMDYPIASVDVGGNSPIHVAIKSKAPLGVLQAFKTVFGEFPFQPDREDKSPLRIALLMKDKDPDVICFIAQSCPKAAKLQMYDGKQPAVFAAARNYPDKVVKQLLLCDMPIHFGGQSQMGVNDVILRTHSYSWWNIATKYPKYGSVLNDILTNSANLHEVVALAQESDSQGFGCLFESTFGDVKTVFKNNLVFGERYEVIATFRAIVRNGLLKVCALDWGDGIAWEELAATEGSLPQLMNDGYTTVNTVGNGTEVVYYSKPQREVLLHCCAKDSDQYQELLEEMDARKKFNFSHIDCQRLYNVHTFDGKRIGCTGPMLCLSFERPLLTLQDVFETSRFRKRKNSQWGRKTWNLLKRLAQVLQYFHSVGYVHGYVETNSIGKFVGSNNWKLLDMRHATKIGQNMRGELRSCVPPESVSCSRIGFSESVDRMKSISFDEDFQNTKPVNYSVSFDEAGPDINFTPESCVADPSWDIYSFGLVVGQLVLGQSMVLLPNFEKASDAHLKKLYQYDYERLKKIHRAALRVAGGKVADLLAKCLQPIPDERPKSMSEILKEPYFDDINKIK